MASLPAERTANPVQVIRQNLTQMSPEFRAALPSHVSVEKFTRVAMTAIQNNPDLQGADRRSLFGAIVRLAQDGLLPDGREAALVMFGKQVQAMPMIAGVLKKIRQSGEVRYVSAQIVYANDRFKWTLGFDENIEHEPAPLDQEPGEAIAAYAVAVLKDGSRLLEVMRKADIEKVRNVSRAKGNGPWVTWWGEMARKTVMRRLSKRLPMSTDLDDAFERDQTMTPAEGFVPQVIENTPEPASRLDALEQHIEDEAVDVEAEEASGPDQSQTGDAFDNTPEGQQRAGEVVEQVEDDTPAWKASVDAVGDLIAAATDQAGWTKADKEFQKIMAGLPDDVAASVQLALDAKKAALKGEG